jgi:hypothetical protein
MAGEKISIAVFVEINFLLLRELFLISARTQIT